MTRSSPLNHLSRLLMMGSLLTTAGAMVGLCFFLSYLFNLNLNFNLKYGFTLLSKPSRLSHAPRFPSSQI